MSSGGSKQRSISSFFAPKKGPQPAAVSTQPDAAPSSAALAAQPSAQQLIAGPTKKQPAPKRAASGSARGAATHTQANAHSEQDASAQEPTAKRARVTAEPQAADHVAIPARSLGLAAKAQRKLVTNKDGEHVLDPTSSTPQHGSASQRAGGSSVKIKYTPLEQQVVELKHKHPGVLLCVEVGYKFRMFGEDAEVGARVCNIYAFPDHNFLTCGFPVFRLPVYVRRLVNAGHKVGVVRQVETAAIKSQSASRNAPFERKLTALYTAATLDAGQRADKTGEEGSLEEFAELDNASIGTVQKYILFVAESPATSHAASASTGQGADIEVLEISSDGEAEAAPHAAPRTSRGERTGGRGGGSKGGRRGAVKGAAHELAGAGEGALALLAVEPSTGDVQMGLTSGGAASMGTGAAGGSGGSVFDLEAVLLSMSPAELVVLEPLSTATNRMLQAYVSSVPGCRLERLRGWGPGTPAADLQRQLQALYADSGEARLQAAMRLPRHAQLTLAAAAAHLGSFGLDGVLRLQPQDPLVGAGTEAAPEGVQAGGAEEEDKATLLRDAGLQPMQRSRGMQLGPNALRQLEVLASSDNGQYRGSLLHLLDRTSTAAGGRLLRAWVSAPLTDAALINARLDAVEELAGVKGASRNAGPLSRLPDTLRRLPDLERGLTRLLHRTAPPSELVATLCALNDVPASLGLQYDPSTRELQDLPPGAVTTPLITALLAAAAAADAHAACTRLLGSLDLKAAKANRTADCLTDPQQFEDVAKAKQAVQDALAALQALLPGLAKELGVRALEYTSIQNQGDWLIEVPVEMEKRVPKTWSRVCGTKKVGRYHPPSVQSAMLHLAISKEQLDATALTAYNRFLGSFLPHYAACKAAATALAQLDALCALAAVARSPGFCRPTVLSPSAAPTQLVIHAGRHPMLDAQLEAGAGPRMPGGAGVAGGAVPNDVVLEATGCRAAIITGPNMGGKSCLLRQAALTAIMAQVGSFVPAESCRMTALDGVYTRMGASDNLLLGRSTFLEELGDASSILAKATSRSLVVMDELGRGTATHDGVAIATATLSHLVTHIQCLTLFVTHYPEVAQMVDSHGQHVRAYHMAHVREEEPCDDQSEFQDMQLGAQQPADPCTTLQPTGTADQPCNMQLDTTSPAAEAANEAADMQVDGQDAVLTATARGELAPRKPPDQGAEPELAAGPSLVQPGSTDLGLPRVTVSGRKKAVTIPRITFLYKLQEGAADQSFGLNVASMAGLPRQVVESAAERAEAMQRAAEDRKALTTTQRVVRVLRDARSAVDHRQQCNLLQAALAEIPTLMTG